MPVCLPVCVETFPEEIGKQLKKGRGAPPSSRMGAGSQRCRTRDKQLGLGGGSGILERGSAGAQIWIPVAALSFVTWTSHFASQQTLSIFTWQVRGSIYSVYILYCLGYHLLNANSVPGTMLGSGIQM